jgi:hypothetical protein
LLDRGGFAAEIVSIYGVVFGTLQIKSKSLKFVSAEEKDFSNPAYKFGSRVSAFFISFILLFF